MVNPAGITVAGAAFHLCQNIIILHAQRIAVRAANTMFVIRIDHDRTASPEVRGFIVHGDVTTYRRWSVPPIPVHPEWCYLCRLRVNGHGGCRDTRSTFQHEII